MIKHEKLNVTRDAIENLRVTFNVVGNSYGCERKWNSLMRLALVAHAEHTACLQSFESLCH
jgi:hypothetical protein